MCWRTVRGHTARCGLWRHVHHEWNHAFSGLEAMAMQCHTPVDFASLIFSNNPGLSSFNFSSLPPQTPVFAFHAAPFTITFGTRRDTECAWPCARWPFLRGHSDGEIGDTEVRAAAVHCAGPNTALRTGPWPPAAGARGAPRPGVLVGLGCASAYPNRGGSPDSTAVPGGPCGCMAVFGGAPCTSVYVADPFLVAHSAFC